MYYAAELRYIKVQLLVQQLIAYLLYVPARRGVVMDL
jgi:hypothetical protein